MSVQLRAPAGVSEYEQIAALHTLMPLEPVLPQVLFEAESSPPPDVLRRRMVATDANGQIVGVSRVRHEKWMEPTQYDLAVVVAESHRRQGIGAQLYSDAFAFARAQGASDILAWLRDHNPTWRAFAEKRGFALKQHWRYFELDLAAFDAEPFAAVIARVESTGIRFAPFSAFAPTPEHQRKLYDLNRRTSLDAPGEDSFPLFEEFVADILSADWFQADGQILALDGDQWVGLGAVGLDLPRASNAFTGVDRSYRRRSIALALTLLGIRYAQQNGATQIEVFNDSRNIAMLAMQDRLGYTAIPGKYVLQQAVG